MAKREIKLSGLRPFFVSIFCFSVACGDRAETKKKNQCPHVESGATLPSSGARAMSTSSQGRDGTRLPVPAISDFYFEDVIITATGIVQSRAVRAFPCQFESLSLVAISKQRLVPYGMNEVNEMNYLRARRALWRRPRERSCRRRAARLRRRAKRRRACRSCGAGTRRCAARVRLAARPVVPCIFQ